MAKKEAGSSMVKWDEELARDAQVAAGMAASLGGSKFISIRGGILAVDGAPIPGNRFAGVIVGWTLENAYYEGEFDPDEPKPPTCYAFGRDVTSMAPHEEVVKAGDAVSEECRGCPNNAWGSADKGRGKACKNIARLAIIQAGQYMGESGNKLKLITDSSYYEKAEVRMLKLPVTSVSGFTGYIKQVQAAYGEKTNLAQFATKVACVPDPKSQYKITLEAIQQLPKDVMPAVFAKWKETQPTMAQAYPAAEEAPKGKKGKNGKPSKPRY